MKIDYNSAYVQTGTFTRPPKLICEEHHHPSHSQQTMDSLAACSATCAMPTADESNHSVVGTVHLHHTDEHTTTTYNALHFRVD